MMELGFYFIVLIFSGYATGTFFVHLYKSIRYTYNSGKFLHMFLYILCMPFLPLMFLIIILAAGFGVELGYVFLTGQI